jgi:hypothetical protein
MSLFLQVNRMREAYEMLSRSSAIAVFAALTLGSAPECRADLFEFTYSDPYGDQANGILSTSGPDGLGDSGLWVTGGSITITANPQFLPQGGGNVSSKFPANHYVGTYDLQPAGPLLTNFYGHLTSGDNVLYPGGVADSVQPGLALPGQSYLDGGGLLFATAPVLMNIYGVGNGVYGLQIVNLTPSGTPYTDLGAWGPEAGSLTLTPVPEPSTMLIAAIGGLVLVAFGVRRDRCG